jgi:CDP-ribitol ribitolphosphotransferase / teichoic acid ribitol-phosphate polymerase
MNDFLVSDIMISDTSSILYEYLITDKPIIVVKNDCDDLHRMPGEMDIMNYATIFDGSQDIVKLIDQNLADQKFKAEYNKLLHNCFYFNDGKSVERIREFLTSIS